MYTAALNLIDGNRNKVVSNSSQENIERKEAKILLLSNPIYDKMLLSFAIVSHLFEIIRGALNLPITYVCEADAFICLQCRHAYASLW